MKQNYTTLPVLGRSKIPSRIGIRIAYRHFKSILKNLIKYDFVTIHRWRNQGAIEMYTISNILMPFLDRKCHWEKCTMQYKVKYSHRWQRLWGWTVQRNRILELRHKEYYSSLQYKTLFVINTLLNCDIPKNPWQRPGPIWFRKLFLVGVSARGLIQGEFIVMFYGPILISLLF